MPEYTKMKNADLEALLKERGLPTGGKKADMVDRLTKDDDKKPAGEDEIDWDDEVDDATAEAAKAAPATSEDKTETTTTHEATVEKAGGEGQALNPQAVPNQIADIDPAQTDDLTVQPPVEGEKEGSADVQAEEKTEEKKEPAPDYSRGLAATKLDEEIEKRKKRALKFGTKFEDDEGLKKLERAKKFGESAPPKGLDEALPERERNQKRRREDAEDTSENKRRSQGRFEGRGGRSGRGRRDNRDSRESHDTRDTRNSRNNRGDDRSSRREDGGRPASGYSEKDKAAAEARKARFAPKPAA
ncbi:hypothetical protein P153DRAFT_394321 [Dothidotthia symphoricarpi CBS 119687]|uniref:SAP domain-containing protein n=1 Tax=Dothidotthia symphoricarpi CBS 119687 TaxID=1392245 RepID=A0A6A6AM41_9PLEO|nr:uncharacterized protein P153DRAFT_394321 [Dothidotthia symphoricarpi CBS 119687]KAF2132155.1 hypothetical protein P153DRAFT_394321 [Dothidotthia symphoricarpi CBS 119687]